MPPAFSPQTIDALHRMALDKQVADRIPGLVAGVGRQGSLDWWTGIGCASADRPDDAPDADTQFAIASITKTFVAVVVMALRDEGRLALDDTVDTLLTGSAHGVTVRQLLAHASGMQREPVGDIWDTLVFPERDALVSGWDEAARVGRPHDRFHYSNLGFAILGEVIARLDGGDWFASIQRRILDPLAMTRTTLGLSRPHATGYFVPPFTDVPVEEPALDLLAAAPAGGMASTLADLARWGGFLAEPTAEVLHPDTLEEMCQPQVVVDLEGWTHTHGLGLMLLRERGRTWVGHTGGFPGFITGLMVHRDSGTAGLVLTNATSATAPGSFAAQLGSYAVEHEPALPAVWRPGTLVPEELSPLLGRWYSEGRAFVFTVREGRLEVRAEATPDAPPSLFEHVVDDTWRTTSGRERGELLRLRRDDQGRVTRLNWATYLFTREPYAFGEWLTER
ncbi:MULTISPECIES: serine hydrolase domain-containing protein [unclassified Knoellia]|uniref:serine hydrolase domain-containing protein n=1 Tax=Knoellia altitudinis TaxID=3404795 RepID=UPI00361DBC7D